MEPKIFILSKQSAAALTDQQLADTLLGGQHRVIGNVSLWKRENPERYKVLQQLRRDQGQLGETTEARNRRLAGVQEPAKPRLLDADEQLARDQVSEAEFDRIIANQGAGSPDNLVQMAKNDPQRNYNIRLAGYSYGKLSRRPEKPAQVKEQITETFELAPNLCEKFNVAPGTHVTLEQFSDLAVKHQQDERTRTAAAVATEQDPALPGVGKGAE